MHHNVHNLLRYIGRPERTFRDLLSARSIAIRTFHDLRLPFILHRYIVNFILFRKTTCAYAAATQYSITIRNRTPVILRKLGGRHPAPTVSVTKSSDRNEAWNSPLSTTFYPRLMPLLPRPMPPPAPASCMCSPYGCMCSPYDYCRHSPQSCFWHVPPEHCRRFCRRRCRLCYPLGSWFSGSLPKRFFGGASSSVRQPG